jgi:signal transduction histidine kinase
MNDARPVSGSDEATRLAGSVAHAINNPLAALLGTVEMALESRGGERQALHRVLHLAHRIESVVASTLQLFRLDAPRREPVAMSDLIESLRRELSARSSPARIGVETKLDSELPEIQADPELLATALTALAENGVEAMAEHGGQLWLEAERAPGDGVVVRVIDSGAGIALALRERVFEPFFTTKGGGTGLGLSIANHIVTQHGGRIELTARHGGGTTATVHLPPR